VQKGDLNTTPLVALLRSLAEERAIGCLHVFDVDADEALVYFKHGLIYSVSVPGRRPQLGSRLVSSGALAPDALAEALEAQRTELQGWRLGELLVHLGYVDQPVVEAFVNEQVHEAMWDLFRWMEGTWKFRKGEKTREDVTTPLAVEELLGVLRERQERWEQIAAVVHGPTAVPLLSARADGTPPELMLDPDAWSLLCKIDGERTVGELARECGYTLYEIGRILVTLVTAGLVDVEVDINPEADPHPRHHAGPALGEPGEAAQSPDEEILPAVTRLAHALAGDDLEPDVPSPIPLSRTGPTFADSLAKVSAALAAVLGPQQLVEDPFEVPLDLRMGYRKPEPSVPATDPEDPELERRERVRVAAAAELAAAHAMAEALRAQQEQASGGGADIVDLSVIRRSARLQPALEVASGDDASGDEVEEADSDRIDPEQVVAAETEAWADYALRLAEEVTAAEEAAWAEHGERLAAELAAAELDAWDEHALRVAEEVTAAEEAAWAEHGERLAAELAAAELDAWDEYWAREAEATRIAAEQEATRLAAELAAAELDAWDEYWAREAEATRIAAEQEATRLAAEQEAARLAAEQEAARLAAEQEATRLAAEQEAARLAEEQAAVDVVQMPVPKLAETGGAPEPLGVPERSRLHDGIPLQVMNEFSAALAAGPEPVEPVTAVAVETEEPPARPVRSELADTAALLRELSSLGLDDDEPASRNNPPAPPRQAPPPTNQKPRKRGFFGR
jgi:hypothetical protein